MENWRKSYTVMDVAGKVVWLLSIRVWNRLIRVWGTTQGAIRVVYAALSHFEVGCLVIRVWPEVVRVCMMKMEFCGENGLCPYAYGGDDTRMGGSRKRM